jgi:Uma2 family endonuclease
MSTNIEATVEDLYHVPENGKAEIVNGEIVTTPPTGDLPSRAGGSVYASLRAHEGKTPGRAYPDNAGFLVHLPNRRSFSPDASWYVGPSTGMKFLEGVPVFAVEVRSEDDYGGSAERAMAQKRADYFAAGTLIVWDVDLLSPDVVKSYNAADPDTPKIFRRGEIADAEPAVPGWKIPVDELFS